MAKPNAQVRMKALVAARLLMGEFDTWEDFERERETAAKITNRRMARSVSVQIGRRYSDLSAETHKFISENFARCDYDDLARLCEEVPAGLGLYLRLDEFEETFFPLVREIRDRFPFHAHVSISPYGLRFEFPEHHFLKDLEAAFTQMVEIRSRIVNFPIGQTAPKERRGDARDLVSREKFLSRSIISAAFSLAEAFLSGVFFTAIHTRSFGRLNCTDDFLAYAKKKESAPLRDRLDRVVKFASQCQATGGNEPFKSFIASGKRYRDAIHHTTPFERKDVREGGRLLLLYEIDGDVAVQIALFSLDTVLHITRWAYEDSDATAIGADCSRLREKAIDLLGSTSGSEIEPRCSSSRL